MCVCAFINMYILYVDNIYTYIDIIYNYVDNRYIIYQRTFAYNSQLDI